MSKSKTKEHDLQSSLIISSVCLCVCLCVVRWTDTAFIILLWSGSASILVYNFNERWPETNREFLISPEPATCFATLFIQVLLFLWILKLFRVHSCRVKCGILTTTIITLGVTIWVRGNGAFALLSASFHLCWWLTSHPLLPLLSHSVPLFPH